MCRLLRRGRVPAPPAPPGAPRPRAAGPAARRPGCRPARSRRRWACRPSSVYNWETGRARIPVAPRAGAGRGAGHRGGHPAERSWRRAPDRAAPAPLTELRQLRRRTGLSQAHVARRIGATRHRLGAWERGERPPLSAVRRLAVVYGVPVARVARAAGVPPRPCSTCAGGPRATCRRCSWRCASGAASPSAAWRSAAAAAPSTVRGVGARSWAARRPVAGPGRAGRTDCRRARCWRPTRPHGEPRLSRARRGGGSAVDARTWRVGTIRSAEASRSPRTAASASARARRPAPRSPVSPS